VAYVNRQVVTVTTDASGDGTGYTDAVTGYVQTIRYVKTDFANGVDFTITAEATGESILAVTDGNASATYAPRQATVSVANAASLYAAGGTAVNDRIAVANDRIKIVVAQGGDTKTGTFHVVLA
jgi:hypothetical protein